MAFCARARLHQRTAVPVSANTSLSWPGVSRPTTSSRRAGTGRRGVVATRLAMTLVRAALPLDSHYPVQRLRDTDQVAGRHRVARDQAEKAGIVPDHNGRAAPIDIVRRRFRSLFVGPRRAPGHLDISPVVAIRHREREASGLPDARARLAQYEATIMCFERSIIQRKLTHLVIAHMDPDRLKPELRRIPRNQWPKCQHRRGRLPGRGSFKMRIARHVSRCPAPARRMSIIDRSSRAMARSSAVLAANPGAPVPRMPRSAPAAVNLRTTST